MDLCSSNKRSLKEEGLVFIFFGKISSAMYERAQVGISWEMLLCFLLGLTIYLFSDGDSDGSSGSDGNGDSWSFYFWSFHVFINL